MTDKLPKWLPGRGVLAGMVLGLVVGGAGMKFSAPVLNGILPALVPGLQVVPPEPAAETGGRETDHDKLIRTRTDVDHLLRDLETINGKLDDIGAALGVQFAKKPTFPPPSTRRHRAWADRDRDLQEREPTQ